MGQKSESESESALFKGFLSFTLVQPECPMYKNTLTHTNTHNYSYFFLVFWNERRSADALLRQLSRTSTSIPLNALFALTLPSW